MNFSLQPGGAGGKMSAEQAKKEAERVEGIKTAFAQGAELSNAGKYDEAVAKFNEVLALVPKCAECYINIGAIQSRKQDWAKAEEAYKKAIELNPESVEAYNGLANVYNAQKKFSEAQAMSAEASKRDAGRRDRRRQRRHAVQPGRHRLERATTSPRRRSCSPRRSRRTRSTRKPTSCSGR